MAKDDGGPAFPRPNSTSPGGYVEAVLKSRRAEDYAHSGMSLRDYFAGQAVSGVVGGYVAVGLYSTAATPVIADRCYELADALLKARAK